LEPETERQAEAARRVAARLLGADVESIEAIGGGRNSRVYRVVGSDRSRYALKAYFRHELETRDRLKAEFEGLGFLWGHGVRCIAQPLAADPQDGYALYTYVEGQKVPAGRLAAADIDAAIGFLAHLKELAGVTGSESLSRASEACFSGNELMANLQMRLDRLVRLPDDVVGRPSLREFIDDELMPAFDRMTSWSRRHMVWDRELPRDQQTLSPSDFGFHNALRLESGEWVFLDFEYFGWDDPAKTISDFVLHPGMELAFELRRRFADGLRTVLGDDGQLADRVKHLFPLFGLKWCLILLNEFLPVDRLRRQFAASLGADRAAVLAGQLGKSRRMLQQVASEYEHNPWFE
jgi:hypothetical protein